jgi:hypothetical protein
LLAHLHLKAQELLLLQMLLLLVNLHAGGVSAQVPSL